MKNLKFIKKVVLTTVFMVGTGLTIAGGTGVFIGHEKTVYTVIMITGIIFLIIDWLVVPGIFKRLK